MTRSNFTNLVNISVNGECYGTRSIITCIRIVALTILIVCGDPHLGVASDNVKRESENGQYIHLRTFEKFFKSTRRPSKKWDDLIGHKIVVEGIAWNGYAKGEEPYVIMDRSVIYIDAKKYPNLKVQGSPIRIFGTLTMKDFKVDGVKPGTKRVIRVFTVKASSHVVLKKVTWPWMRQLKYYNEKNKNPFK